jgi:iron complex outermembrane receptor protein
METATVGKATCVGTGVPSDLWVADTPLCTQGAGFTYQQRNVDLGLFEKRIGAMWNDNGACHNQAKTRPFNLLNVFLNYTIRNHTHFDQTHLGPASTICLTSRM